MIYGGSFMTNLQKFSIVSLYQQLVESEYKELFDLVCQKAKRYELNFKKVAVTSSFGINNGVATCYGTDIDLADEYEIIDEKIYKELAEKAESSKVNPDMKVCLGYGMRIVNLSVQNFNASITTGSHCAITNSIYFDIKTYLQLGAEAMIHRFAHEMLHEFGYQEIDALKYEQEYYEKIRLLVKPLIYNIYSRLHIAERNLQERINLVFSDGSKEKEILDALFDKLMVKGCINLETATIAVLHPITHMQTNLLFI